MALILASFFLVSFTGFRVLVHHCFGCDTSEIVITGVDHDCCQTKYADDDSCCTENALLPGNHKACDIEHGEGCCDSKPIYLKGDFELISERTTIKIESPVLAALVVGVETIANHKPGAFSPRTTTFEEPPPRLTGRDFVLYSHQLKIS